MKKILSLLLLSTALISCRSSSGRSNLDAASFADGNMTYLAYSNTDPNVAGIIINKCLTTPEITAIMGDRNNLEKAKALCKAELISVSNDAMRVAISAQISSISVDEILNAKTNRLKYVTGEINRMEQTVSSLKIEIANLSASSANEESKRTLQRMQETISSQLADLQTQQKELSSALSAAKNDASMKMLKDIDIKDTLQLVEKGKENADQAADIFMMLLNKNVLYNLDVNRNRILVKAIQNFDPVCKNDSRTFADGQYDQGLERISYDCVKGGGIRYNQISCPVAGYERNGNTCVFTGKGVNVSTMSASHSGLCAVTKGKAVTCWGKAGTFPLNHIATTSVKAAGFGRKTEEELAGLGGGVGFGGSGGTPIAQMLGNFVVGSDHAMCSLDGSNKLNRCWPEVNAAPLDNDVFTAVQGGYAHYCGITANKAVKCWGENSYNQTSVVNGLSDVKSIAIGEQSSCALTESGKVECWGTHVGPRSSSMANAPSNLGKVIAISNGASHACAIGEDNAVRCWGQNDYGQTNVPSDLGAVRTVLAARYQSCAITVANGLRCWGGIASTDKFPVQPAPALSDVTRLTSGNFGFNVCAITKAGKVSCWGSKSYSGESSYDVNPPANLGSVEDVAITAMGYFCGRMTSGGLSCWGNVKETGANIPAIFSN
jgi:hypothetical protein